MLVAREINKNALRRAEIREDHWPGMSQWIWDPTSQKLNGFVGVSRLMPWITTLIRHLSERGDPTGVYWEFWCRHMGQGIVEVKDEEECAFAAGYTSSRALRTWYEHVEMLSKCHFIDVKEVGRRKVGYVLLPNPLAVARWHYEQEQQKHEQKPKPIPQGWWTSFKDRVREIGAEMPEPIDMSLLSSDISRTEHATRDQQAS
jgi:hypothetical protein